MKVYKDTTLLGFRFWGPAKTVADKLDIDEFRQIEAILEDLYPDGIEDVQLNDIFAYDTDFVAQMIGLEDADELYNRDYEEEE